MKLPEAGKHYRTRDGRKATVLATDVSGAHLVVGYVERGENVLLTKWDINGKWNRHDVETDLDLVAEWREPVKVEGYVNVYPRGRYAFHTTKESADEMAMSDRRIACVYVSGTEGDEP